MKERIGIFGGSFNPPHIGHLLICHYSLAIYDLDQVWLIPVKDHPLGKRLINVGYRHSMCGILTRFDNKVLVYDYSYYKYTVDLLERLTAEYSHIDFSLIIGSDIHEELSKWKEWGRIQELAGIITIHRQGHDLPNISGSDIVRFPNISSTEIRERIKNGQDVNHLVPKGVLEYIKQNNLTF